MRLALINHYDSFVFNLFQYLAELLGAAPEVIAHDAAQPPRDEDFDAFVISPGPGHPACARDIGLSAALIAQTRRPVLGVCLGHQAIVTGCGGIVGRAPEPVHGRTARIQHDGRDLFAGLPQDLTVMRYHSLCAQAPLPPGLRQVAQTRDGLVMAVTHAQRPLWGVQFHPESIASEHGKALLSNFLDLAGRTRAAQRIQVQPWAGRTAAPVWQVVHRRVAAPVAPEAVFERLYAASPSGFWLDSSSAEAGGAGRWSWMGDASGPLAYQLRYRVGEGVFRLDAGASVWTRCPDPDPFAHVDAAVGAPVAGADALPFDFCGGFVGYWGYELKALTHPMTNRHRSPWPDACLAFIDRFVAWDAGAQCFELVALLPAGADPAQAASWLASTQAVLESLAQQPAAPEPPEPASCPGAPRVTFTLERDQAAYLAQIAQAQAAIAAGESYEVCLTNRLRAAVTVDPWALYRCLRRVNPAPYSAWLACGDFHVLSASPEGFLSVDRQGRVKSDPIKGTRPRHPDPDSDARVAAELAAHPKDRAENLMIVDLVRNDLGQVCQIGSVTVPELLQVRSYASVHQLVSTVVGQLRPDCSAIDALRAAFPGGSMTGAPKLRTMALLDELEGSARGVYSGCLGYVSLQGTAQLGMVIRTLVRDAQHLQLGMGGAIVSLSDAQAEFSETLLKARALMAATAWCVTGDPQAYQIEGLDPACADGRVSQGSP